MKKLDLIETPNPLWDIKVIIMGYPIMGYL